jgi:hypothetical protein
MELTTRNGKKIVGVQYKPFNSIGNRVTFPIKGTIILSEKPTKKRYQIWTIEGRNSITRETEWDIVDLPDIKTLGWV